MHVQTVVHRVLLPIGGRCHPWHLPRRLQHGVPLARFGPVRTYRHWQSHAVVADVVALVEVHPRGHARICRSDHGAIRSFERKAQQPGSGCEQDDVGHNVRLGQPEANALLLSGRDVAFRVQHDIGVGDAGQDLLIILRQAEEIVGAQGAGHEQVAAGAIGDGAESHRVDFLRGTQPDGEDVLIDIGGHIGDEGGGVLLAIGEHDHGFDVIAGGGIEDLVGALDAVADGGGTGGIGMVSGNGSARRSAPGIEGSGGTHDGDGKFIVGILIESDDGQSIVLVHDVDEGSGGVVEDLHASAAIAGVPIHTAALIEDHGDEGFGTGDGVGVDGNDPLVTRFR